MIKNIIFDWSGVISNDVELCYHSSMNVFRLNDGKEITFEEFRKEWDQPYMIFFNKFMPNLTKEKQDSDFIIAYPKLAKKYPPRAFPGVRDTLRRLKNNGVRMSILSSNLEEFIEKEIISYKLEGIFEDMSLKIHDKTRAVAYMMERNGYATDESCIIGDTTHEVETGRCVGIKTVSITWGYQLEEKLRSASPDYLIHDIGELEKIILG